MDGEVVVHERISLRHPEIEARDVIHAWRHAFVMQRRELQIPGVVIALGVDWKGRVLEMIGAGQEDGRVLVFHAFTPPTKTFLEELGVG